MSDRIFLLLLIAFVTASCSNKLQKDEKCDLEKLNLHGKITKLEVITQTSIPISEWLYSTVNSDYSKSLRGNAVYAFLGNAELDFDKDGNLENQIVYDNEGRILYKELPTLNSEITLYNPINIKVNELSDVWSFIYDKDGRIVCQTTIHDGKEFLKRRIKYNDKGDIDKVVCQFVGLKMEIADSTVIPADTTYFTYTAEDSQGNWTAATVYHKGRFNYDTYKVNVKRRITYEGESQDSSPLIASLQDWNKEAKENSPGKEYPLTSICLFDNSISLSIPKEMEALQGNSVPNNIIYQLKNDEGFFNVSIAKEAFDGGIFDYYSNPDIEKEFTHAMGSRGAIILRWGDCFTDTKVNNQSCVYINYHFYASGGYLNTGDPVETDVYQFQSESDGPLYSVCIGYDGNHEYLYKPLAEKIKNTIKINN